MNTIRRVTLVLGGILGVGALVVTGVFAAWGVSFADPDRVQTTIPANATAVEIDIDDGLSYGVNVEVQGLVAGNSSTGEAHIAGATSVLKGAVPTLNLEMRGTTAVITIVNPRPTYDSGLWGQGPYGVNVRLPADRRFDAITIRSSGSIYVQGVQATTIDARASSGQVYVGVASDPDRITAQGAWNTVVAVPNDGTSWQVLTPAWFDVYPSSDGSICTQPQSDPYSSCNTNDSFGVYLPSVAGADHVIDVQGTTEGTMIHVGYLLGG